MLIVESTNFEIIASLIAESPALVRPPSARALRIMHRAGAVFLLALYDSYAVGVVCIKKLNFFLSEMKYLYVKPEYRRRGIGRKLVAKGLDIIDDRFKTPVVVCTAVVTNISALALFTSFRFRVIASFRSPVSERRIMLLVRNIHEVAPAPEEEEGLILEV